MSSLDPDTGKRSEETLGLFITVPFLVIEAPTLTVDQPTEGATFENGAIPVQGTTTNAESVVVSAAYTGSVGSRDARARRSPAAAGRAEARSRSTVAEDGTFTHAPGADRRASGRSRSPRRAPRARRRR